MSAGASTTAKPGINLRDAGWIVAILVLGAYLASGVARNFPNQIGADLYPYWAVTVARDTGAPMRNPYAESAAYGEHFNKIATTPGASPKLFATAQFWANRSAAKFESTPTPLLFAAVSFLPADFDRAHLTWAILQYTALAASVYGLARMRGAARLPALGIAVFVLGTFNPFIYDVMLANVASLQLAFLVALLFVAARRLYLRHVWIDRLYLGALALLLCLKPNMLWVALAMAIHYAVVRGTRPAAIGAGVGAIVVLVAFGLGAWYFGDANIWWDWIRYTRGMGGGTLIYSTHMGNQALPVLLAERYPVLGPVAYSVLLMALLGGALALSMSSWGKRVDQLVPTLRTMLSDPWFAMSLGVVFTFAAAPLVWYHYYVPALIPIAWMLRWEAGWKVSAACALTAYALMMAPVLGAIFSVQPDLALLAMYFPWTPLVFGLVLRAQPPGVNAE
jgi:hypothetical protein